MGKTAEDYLNVWRSWIGYSEMNGKYMEIINIYNEMPELPRGYRVTPDDAWCDVTVSAAAIKSGMQDIIGVECGCEEHIKIFKKKGIWIEDGTIYPEPGYIIVYNWNDNIQPNDGYADHIGVVEEVVNGEIICIEGNYQNGVKRRKIAVGSGNIRGYAAPRYENKVSVSVGEEDKKDSINRSVMWEGIVKVNSYLNVRQWAGEEYETCSFSPLYNGDKIGVCDKIISSDNSIWYYIQYKGKYGFVHSAYVSQILD